MIVIHPHGSYLYLSMPKDVTIEEVPEIRDVDDGDD